MTRPWPCSTFKTINVCWRLALPLVGHGSAVQAVACSEVGLGASPFQALAGTQARDGRARRALAGRGPGLAPQARAIDLSLGHFSTQGVCMGDLDPWEFFSPDGSVWSVDYVPGDLPSVLLRQVFPSGGGLPPADAELCVPGPVLGLAAALLKEAS